MRLKDFEIHIATARHVLENGGKYICHALINTNNGIESCKIAEDFYELMMPDHYDEDNSYGFYGDPRKTESQKLRLKMLDEFEQLVIEDELYEHY